MIRAVIHRHVKLYLPLARSLSLSLSLSPSQPNRLPPPPPPSRVHKSAIVPQQAPGPRTTDRRTAASRSAHWGRANRWRRSPAAQTRCGRGSGPGPDQWGRTSGREMPSGKRIRSNAFTTTGRCANERRALETAPAGDRDRHRHRQSMRVHVRVCEKVETWGRERG